MNCCNAVGTEWCCAASQASSIELQNELCCAGLALDASKLKKATAKPALPSQAFQNASCQAPLGACHHTEVREEQKAKVLHVTVAAACWTVTNKLVLMNNLTTRLAKEGAHLCQQASPGMHAAELHNQRQTGGQASVIAFPRQAACA